MAALSDTKCDQPALSSELPERSELQYFSRECRVLSVLMQCDGNRLASELWRHPTAVRTPCAAPLPPSLLVPLISGRQQMNERWSAV